jgi:hypothetical protein
MPIHDWIPVLGARRLRAKLGEKNAKLALLKGRNGRLALELRKFKDRETRKALLDHLDHASFDELCRSTANSHGHNVKYDNLELQVARAWKDAKSLGLQNSPPIEVLDLGTGPGFFPYVCHQLGHRCVALDMPGDFAFWTSLHQWLGLTRTVTHEIRANEPLPPDIGQFNLVTAFRAQFHYNATEKRLWDIAEWSFFLDYLRDHVLKPGGKFALNLNPQDHRRGRAMSRQSGRNDEVLLSFMVSRGATLRRDTVVFAPLV